MRPTVGPISSVTVIARGRLERLRALASRLVPPLAPEDRRLLSYVTIEAANLWAQYSRVFYFSMALGARDATGRRVVALPANDVESALDLAVYALRPNLAGTKRVWTKGELPDWQNKGHLARLVEIVGPVLWPEVDRAVSYSTRVLSDLPTMRNFYAHKAERAAKSARDLRRHYGITGAVSPHELLCSRPAFGADLLINEWLADLSAILSLMP